MIESFFIYNRKGEVLISRIFKKSMKNRSELFKINVIASKNPAESPINNFEDIYFFHINYENLWLTATSTTNDDVAAIFEFLYKFIGVYCSYFGSFSETSVKTSFLVIYQLLDEMIDFGFIQNMEFENLSLYINSDKSKQQSSPVESQNATLQTTAGITWRSNNIVYKKNQAFVDVIEFYNILVSSKGSTIKSSIDGRVLMKSYLSGMPECKLGLNDLNKSKAPGSGGSSDNKANQVDFQFHQCVRLSQFSQNKSISFIPPDGQFELMRYHVRNVDKIPFTVYPIVPKLGEKAEIFDLQVTIKSNFNSKLVATNVKINIPIPNNATGCNTNIGLTGKAKYTPETNSIVWTIPRFSGNSEQTLKATIKLSKAENAETWSRPPIALNFKISTIALSGIYVKFLQIQEAGNYKTVKWVRYMANSGSYEVRY